MFDLVLVEGRVVLVLLLSLLLRVVGLDVLVLLVSARLVLVEGRVVRVLEVSLLLRFTPVLELRPILLLDVLRAVSERP